MDAEEKTREQELAHRFLINFTYATCKVTFFIKHFFISPILYEESKSINLGFLVKKKTLYAVLILDFTGLNVCITFTRLENFSSI